jgi:hypothetical protein
VGINLVPILIKKAYNMANMPEVRFLEEDETKQKRRPPTTVTKSKFARFFINHGLAKTETQANVYMIVIAIICIALAIYFNTGDAVLPPEV